MLSTSRVLGCFDSGCAVWQHPGLPLVFLRWVLIRDPLRRFVPQALLCTKQGMTALQLVTFFVRDGSWRSLSSARDRMRVPRAALANAHSTVRPSKL